MLPADELEKEGIEVEIIDLVTIRPLDFGHHHPEHSKNQPTRYRGREFPCGEHQQ